MKTNKPTVFGSGALIGTLGGLIGLGGAEFRLPLLIGLFGFASLEAVILNKTMSLIVVASALPFRTGAIPFADFAGAMAGSPESAGRQPVGGLVRCRLGASTEERNPVSGDCGVIGVDRHAAVVGP